MALPAEFCDKMKALLLDEYPEFIESLTAERAHGLRINENRCTKEDFPAKNKFTLTDVPWCKTGYYYPNDERPGKHPYYEAGLYYIQEPSAMAVGELADIKEGEWVLDLCAAPGGKTTHLAPKAELIITNEIHPARAKILSQNVERAGITNAVVTNETPQRLSAYFEEAFDCVVVDAPCSGEGMFRKDEDAQNEWTPLSPDICAKRQDEILDEAVKMVRKGGRLVYSTCTFSPEENEGTLTRLLERYPDFEIVKDERFTMFESGNPIWYDGAPDSVKYSFRLFPHKIKGEGHFCALLRRKGEGERKMPNLTKPLQKLPDTLKEFFSEIKNQPNGEYFQMGERIWRMPVPIDLSGIKTLRTGLEIGTLKKGRFEPAHAFAMGVNPKDMPRCIDFSADSQEIKKYLKGEAITVNAENGWTVVTVDGYAVGWGKVSNGMIKNHFPKGLRWK